MGEIDLKKVLDAAYLPTDAYVAARSSRPVVGA